MNIGFVNIYSFRPHVEHLYYLSALMEKDGHEVFFLACDASVSSCYSKILKQTGKLKECSQCMLGGIRSYPVKNITSLSKNHKNNPISEDALNKLSFSSACTLTRIEKDSECDDKDVIFIIDKLNKSNNVAYQSALAWIDNNNLDAVISFNGRMDMTRAITSACKKLNKPYITHERTWFGDGLLLTPNANCLSLKPVGELVGEFDNKALTFEQASFAGKLIGERFLQQNTLEWRLYNKDATSIKWPIKPTGKKVLILPSSRNEFAGHEDWISGWSDNTKALDDFIEAFSIKPEDIVIRFHPNWSETIGKVSGKKAITLYTEWAEKRNIYFISSDEKANTYDLIQQSDIVVLNGGSSAIEAGACGKQVINLGHATYEKSGFLRNFSNKNQLHQADALNNLDPEVIIRKTLRFVYLSAKRLPQFTGYVKALETTKYKYFDGADPQRLIDMIVTGEVLADDETFAKDESEESAIVNSLKNKSWQSLANYESPICTEKSILQVQRRFGLRWIDGLRAKFSLGDR